jgi:3-oxoacyl-[acyl-carrier-protein] synthase II
MSPMRFVITGVGVLSSNGIGIDSFSTSLCEGVSGVKPVSLFDTALLKATQAGEIADFHPEEIIGSKGLRILDRSTKLINCAAQLALTDAHLTVNDDNSSLTGVIVATTLGSLKSIMDFDKDALVDGPRYVNPAHFPNTVINSPASQVAIRFQIRGLNATIATGFTASLDALAYALTCMKLGRIKIALVGGVEELCQQTYLGFYKAGLLAGAKEGSLEASCPFDKRRNGIIFGEGASIAVVEELESARKRGATIVAEVSGVGRACEPGAVHTFSVRPTSLKRAMEQAIKEAGIGKEEIDYVSAAANSTRIVDSSETQALKETLCADRTKVAVSSIKSMVGECYSASGALQVAGGVSAIQKQIVPATINYRVVDPSCDLSYVVNKSQRQPVRHVLINSVGLGGLSSSVILSRYRGD